MVSSELGVVEMRLPFKTTFGHKDKMVGFRFNILSWFIMCQYFEPEIEFHQIDELQRENGQEILEKLIRAATESYRLKYNSNSTIKERDIKYWLYEVPAKKRDEIVKTLEQVIRASKVMGKTMEQLISESQETEKKNLIG